MLEFHRYPDFTPTPTEYDEMIDDLEKKIEKLEEQINDLDFENGELQDEIEHLKATRIPVEWIKKQIGCYEYKKYEGDEYYYYDSALEILLKDWEKENG